MVASGAIAVTLALGGCGGPQVGAPREENPDLGLYFTQRAESGTTQAKLVPGRLYGPTLELSLRDDGSYVGRFGSAIVDLRTTEERVAGTIGGQPTELYVAPEGEGMRVRGMLAGALGTLDVTPRVVSGRAGRCSYDLKREAASRWYAGRRVCGRGMPEYTSVAFPVAFEARSPQQRAVLADLFLASSL